jgi:aspartokinase-like uncharacterized kinase
MSDETKRWAVTSDGVSVYSRDEAENSAFLIATTHGPGAKANALLIAATPELLAALGLAEEYLSRNVPTDGWGCLDRAEERERASSLKAARAALEKAGVS